MAYPTLLMILDGWGIARNKAVSAVDLAQTPFVDSLASRYPNTTLLASGMAVGLPEGQMGNSEVGHMNLGAGRIVYQDLAKINLAVANNTLGDSLVLQEALKEAAKPGKTLHLIGLVSDGGVHAHLDHLKGLLTLAHQHQLTQVAVHAFTDGRDTDPKSGLGYLSSLLDHMKQTTGYLASVVGRYYAMDRDKRWERVKLAHDLLVNGIGEATTDVLATINNRYAAGETDEFLLPISVQQSGSAVNTIREGDVVINFNFRTDRGRQITMALTQQDFHEQNMHKLNLHYVTLTRYDDTFKGVQVVFEKDNLTHTLGEVLEAAGKKQIRIAETEKYPHVTFFFSGGRETPFEGEKRLLCPSPKVATYDLQPEMAAEDITKAILPELENRTADFVCLNFANPDMVGHTGVMEATIKACETVDQCAQRVAETALKAGYALIILADHGNADCMINEDGTPNTAHTTQPVPCYLLTPDNQDFVLRKDGVLGDVAPTLLELMNLPAPAAMTCKSLIC